MEICFFFGGTKQIVISISNATQNELQTVATSIHSLISSHYRQTTNEFDVQIGVQIYFSYKHKRGFDFDHNVCDRKQKQKMTGISYQYNLHVSSVYVKITFQT